MAFPAESLMVASTDGLTEPSEVRSPDGLLECLLPASIMASDEVLSGFRVGVSGRPLSADGVEEGMPVEFESLESRLSDS